MIASRFLQVMDILEGLELSVQVHLRRRLLHMAAEFQVAQQVVGLAHQGSTESLPPDESVGDDDDGAEDERDSDGSPTPFTPILSATSTPRSVTPEPAHQITVTVNNYVQGNLNFVPAVPPNSPRRRGSRKESRRTRISGNEADVESVASGSTTSLHDADEDLDLSSKSHNVPVSPLVRQPLEPIPSSPPPAYSERYEEDDNSASGDEAPQNASSQAKRGKVDAWTSTSPSLTTLARLVEPTVQPEYVRPVHTKPRSQSDAALFAKTAAATRRQNRLTHNESVQTEPEEERDVFRFPREEEDRSRESSTDPSFLSGEEDNAADELRCRVERLRRAPEGDITEESGVDSDDGVLGEVNTSLEVASTSAMAAERSALSADLSDLTLSPTLSPTLEHVSFKTEVASSRGPNKQGQQSCKC